MYDFQCKLMEEEGVSWDEVQRMCIEEPKYSLGVKFQRVMAGSVVTPHCTQKLIDRMVADLTPAEYEIWTSDEMKQAVKHAFKEVWKSKKKKKVKM